MKNKGFLIFTGVFAVLIAYVFWGTWSTDFRPVMPDDTTAMASAYADVLRRAWVDFLSSGKLIPTDLLWKGFLISPAFCQELKYAVGLYLAGLALAYFLKGRGLSDLASYGAGLLLSFCGYWSTLFSAGHGGWFIWMSYGVFAFGLIDRAFDRGALRHWILLGAVVAWGSFYQPDLWLLFTVFTAAYFIFRLVLLLRKDHTSATVRRICLSTLASAVAFGLIGAPSFYSAIVNDLAGRNAQIAAGETLAPGKKGTDPAAKPNPAEGRERRWVFVTNWSLPFDETAEFFIPRLNGDTSCPLTLSMGGRETGVRPYTGALGRPLGAPQGNYRQHSLYVGWMTCLLALIGVIGALKGRVSADSQPSADRTCAARPRAYALFFLIIGFVFYLCSLGRYCPFVYRMVFALPMGDYLRAPVKWHHLTELCFAVLAGYGIATLESFAKTKGLKIALAVIVLWGVCDLVRIDKLYCAVEPQNYSVQLASVQQISSPQARAYLAQNGYRILGTSNGIATLGKYQRPQPYEGTAPKPGIPAVLGTLSVFASLAVCVFALLGCVRRGRC